MQATSLESPEPHIHRALKKRDPESPVSVESQDIATHEHRAQSQFKETVTTTKAYS